MKTKSITAINKYKCLFTAISVIIILTLVTGCGQNKKYVIDARSGNDGNSSKSGTKNSSTTLPIENAVNPFENLSVQFNGVSPFCTVSFNTSKCSKEIQENVCFSLSPDSITEEGFFEDGEQVTVYASASGYSDEENLVLSCESNSYTVQNVPKYITELTSDIDLSKFQSEAADYLQSVTAFSKGQQYPLGVSTNRFSNNFDSSSELKFHGAYFSALKFNTYSLFPNETDYFNKIDMLYSIKIVLDHGHGEKSEHNVYFSVQAKNIVQYPDGTIGWGKDDPAALSFEHNIVHSNLNDLIAQNITSAKLNYNTDTVTELLKG